jgi:hypothetical protein
MTLVDLVAGFDAGSQTSAIEDLMARNAPLTDVLRVLCLQSLIGGGLKPKEVESLRRQFLQVMIKISLDAYCLGIWL